MILKGKLNIKYLSKLNELLMLNNMLMLDATWIVSMQFSFSC